MRMETFLAKRGRLIAGNGKECACSFAMEADETQMATPRSLRWFGKRRLQAVHVIPTITVVAEKKLFLKRSRKERTFDQPLITFLGEGHTVT